MSSNAQDQVERMLALVPYLRERDGIAVDEVARDFGVPPAQIVKDLKVLWFCGLPNSVSGDMIDIDMEALDGEGVVKLSNADYLNRPLRLVPHEALALTVALRALREVSARDQREVVDRALRKIEDAAGDGAQGAAVVEVALDPVDEQTRAVVEEALRARQRLEIAYYTPGRDTVTRRVVDPMRLIISEGRPYLEAWCHRATEVRIFRLDRIRAAELLDQAAEPPPEADVTDLSKGLFQPDPDDPVAVVDLRPAAHWVAEHYPIERQEARPEAVTRIWIRYSDPGWLQRLVLRLGGQAAIVEPAELADAVRSRAREALALYTAETSS